MKRMQGFGLNGYLEIDESEYSIGKFDVFKELY